MGAVAVSQDGREVGLIEDLFGGFWARLLGRLPEWRRRLAESPESLRQVEQDVHRAFAEGADNVVAGLLAERLRAPEHYEACERTRQAHCRPLREGRARTQQVRLLGGLVIWITSLYCAARRACEAPGLHVELAQFGFGKGASPGLLDRVCRKAALLPSFETAQQELAREGVDLDVKALRRLTHQCGEGMLALRTRWLRLWREGRLPAGDELRGCRVAVQVDGGRTKIRGELREAPPRTERTDDDGLAVENAPGRSRRRPARTCDAEWREPKVMTIFIHDEHGRMVKGARATLDATFLGPDALAELAAMHLHRLGAAQAASVTFGGDGAPWIWDRVPTIVARAGLREVPVHEVLDNCHAAHHIALALAALGLGDRERTPLYRQHRTLLRNGQWRRVVEELGAIDPESAGAATEVAYLRRHGEAGRLSYPRFRSLGLPLGSGAVESGIRRTVNMRLKGNGKLWLEDRAESVLQVRAQVVSGRWDERLDELRAHQCHDTSLDWAWQPAAMSVKAEAGTTTRE